MAEHNALLLHGADRAGTLVLLYYTIHIHIYMSSSEM